MVTQAEARSAKQSGSGEVASGDADSGNPVKIGGVYNSTRPTYTNGDRADLQVDSRGNLPAVIYGPDGVSPAVTQSASTNMAASVVALNVNARPFLYSGTTFEAAVGCQQGQVLASAARTAAISATAGPVLAKLPNTHLHFIINVTANGGAFGLTPTIYGQDPVSSTWYALLVGTKIASNGITVLKIGPGIAASSGAAAQDMVPRTWGYGFAVDDATSVTYSVGYVLG